MTIGEYSFLPGVDQDGFATLAGGRHKVGSRISFYKLK